MNWLAGRCLLIRWLLFHWFVNKQPNQWTRPAILHSENGEEKTDDPEESKEIFSGHLSNMGRLAKEGKLVVAGLFEDGAPKRGLFIFNVTTLKEAEELVNTDPAVKAGVFEYELTKLYCSAALMKINELHGKIQKTKIE